MEDRINEYLATKEGSIELVQNFRFMGFALCFLLATLTFMACCFVSSSGDVLEFEK